MKFNSIMLLVCTLLLVGCNTDKPAAVKSTPKAPNTKTATLDGETVQAACGQCQFDMDGDGCNLAIRYQGDDYLVEGSLLDDHGDAHAETGMCNVIRDAIVSGEIKNGKFTATSFELVPEEALAEGETRAKKPDASEDDD